MQKRLKYLLVRNLGFIRKLLKNTLCTHSLIIRLKIYSKLQTVYRSSRDIESGDYAGSDVQSVSSRLSTLSVDTSRSEHHELGQIISPQYYTQLEGKIRHFRKISGYTRSEDGLSPGQSSDYEDQEDFSNCSQQIATVHVVSYFLIVFTRVFIKATF